jgi:hypothetical protein
MRASNACHLLAAAVGGLLCVIRPRLGRMRVPVPEPPRIDPKDCERTACSLPWPGFT